jgi:hypothetical protein
VAALKGAKLSPQCRVLAEIAEPPNTRDDFTVSLLTASVQAQLQKLQGATGIKMLHTDPRGTPKVGTVQAETAQTVHSRR